MTSMFLMKYVTETDTYIYICKEQYRWAICDLFRLAHVTRSALVAWFESSDAQNVSTFQSQ